VLIDLDGPVHYLDFGGPKNATAGSRAERAGGAEPPPQRSERSGERTREDHSGVSGGERPPIKTMVLVHGLGGSHVNWMGVGESLARHARVFAVDLAGFGHTPLAGRSASIEANRALLDRFIDRVAGGRAVLVGNSMGGLISLMQASTRPKSVEALVMVSAALPRAPGAKLDREVALSFALFMLPGLGRLALRARNRVTPEQASRDLLKLCCVDASRVPEALFKAHVHMNRLRREMPWVEDAFLEATRSLVGTLMKPRKVHAMIEAVRAPTLIMQGDGDRLVSIESARAVAKRRPDFRLEVLRGVGHVPQMETPQTFVEIVSRFCTSLDGRPEILA